MKPFIIIGAGILGASTAYHLAKNGAKVLLIDREDKGQATDAAAGIVCPWVSQRRNKAWYELAKNGARYYSYLIPELEKDGEKDTGYKKVGAISLHTDLNKLDKMEERANKRREDAPEIGEIRRLSELETKDLFPYLDVKFASVHISGAARVNGRELRDALVRGAQKQGAEVLRGNARLEIEAGKVVGVTVSSDSFLGEKVIVTAGAWATELVRPLGIDFLVDAQKAQIVHLDVDEEESSELPVVMPPNDQYIVAFDKGKIVIGATHENDKGFDKRVTLGGLHEIFDKALGIAPGLEEATVSETRVGFRPFTPGFLPVIGSLPNNDEVLVANGLGASGLTVGPYLGFQLAKLALGQPLEIDPELYPVSGAIL